MFNGVPFSAPTTRPPPRPPASVVHGEEERLGDMSFQLPTKARGAWRGEVEVYTADQKLAGTSEVTVEHEPMPDLLRSSATVTWSGVLNRSYRFDRIRNGRTIQLLGPDYFGNNGHGRPR